MDMQLTDAQMQRLAQLAEEDGSSVSDLLLAAAQSILEVDAFHMAAIDRALAQAERGEFIEEEEMDRRVAAMLAR